MLNALFRARIPVLGLVGILAIASCVMFPPSRPYALALAIAFAIAALGSYVHLRHVGLAPAVAFAPLPGMLMALAIGAPDGFAAVLAYLPGFAVAAFLADDFTQRIASGIDRNSAIRDAIGASALSACLAVLVPAGGLGAFLYFFPSLANLAAAAAMIGGGLFAILIVTMVASLLPFGEEFVTRTNRLREWRERVLYRLTFITQPRWAMSFTGIAIVFAVLAFFGAQLAIDANEAVILGAFLIAAFGASFLLKRDWRRALATIMVLALVMLIAFWSVPQIHMQTLFLLLLMLAVCFAPLFLMAAESDRYLSEDAMSLALQRKGAAVLFIFLAAGFILISGPAILFFGCVGALVFQPAIATALETLIPSKAALEARYRVR